MSEESEETAGMWIGPREADELRQKLAEKNAQLAMAIEALRPFAVNVTKAGFTLADIVHAAEVYKELTAEYASKID